MTFNEYQALAKTTAIYPENLKLIYPTLGLAGETGEVVEKVKKLLRGGDEPTPEFVDSVTKELGDVLWYLATIASDLGIPFDQVVATNVTKIQSRQARGVLHGAGDER